MSYNSDFLIAAFIILTIVLWQFFNQKRPNDLNNRTFLHLAVLGILDVFFELITTLLPVIVILEWAPFCPLPSFT